MDEQVETELSTSNNKRRKKTTQLTIQTKHGWGRQIPADSQIGHKSATEDHHGNEVIQPANGAVAVIELQSLQLSKQVMHLFPVELSINSRTVDTCVSTVACRLAPLMGVPLRWTCRTSIEVTNNSEASSFSGSKKKTLFIRLNSATY